MRSHRLHALLQRRFGEIAGHFRASYSRTLRIVLRDPVAISPGPHALHPLTVVQIPTHCLAQPAFKRLSRTPAQLARNFSRINCVAPVVSRPVLNVSDKPLPWCQIRLRPHLVHNAANRRHHIDVRALAVTANVVRLSRSPIFEHRFCANRRAVGHSTKSFSRARSSVHRRKLATVFTCLRAHSESPAVSISPETETAHSYSSNSSSLSAA